MKLCRNYRAQVVVLSAGLFFASCDAAKDPSVVRKDSLRKMAANLFHISDPLLDHSSHGANYNYNDWQVDPVQGCKGYDGGHSGIDMQTKDVEGELTADRDFFAVLPGEVIAAGNDRFNTVAVYNQKKNITVLYLHARKLHVKEGDQVNPVDRLGVQGNAGLGYEKPTTAEHVHVEVREGYKKTPACGADTTLDPVLYL